VYFVVNCLFIVVHDILTCTGIQTYFIVLCSAKNMLLLMNGICFVVSEPSASPHLYYEDILVLVHLWINSLPAHNFPSFFVDSGTCHYSKSEEINVVLNILYKIIVCNRRSCSCFEFHKG